MQPFYCNVQIETISSYSDLKCKRPFCSVSYHPAGSIIGSFLAPLSISIILWACWYFVFKNPAPRMNCWKFDRLGRNVFTLFWQFYTIQSTVKTNFLPPSSKIKHRFKPYFLACSPLSLQNTVQSFKYYVKACSLWYKTRFLWRKACTLNCTQSNDVSQFSASNAQKRSRRSICLRNRLQMTRCICAF